MAKCKMCGEQTYILNSLRNFGEPLNGDDFKCLESHVIMWHYHIITLFFLDNFFIAQKSYWCGTVQNNKEDVEGDSSQTEQTEYFEKDPLGMRAGIRIKNLRKVSLEILLYYIL